MAWILHRYIGERTPVDMSGYDESPLMNKYLFKSGSNRWRGAGRRGFTLIELMIVVVIIGVLAAVSGPTISRSMERSRLADVNRAIVNGFNEARSFAISTGEVVFARVDVGNNRVDFLLPSNAGGETPKALSCAVATRPDAGAPDDGGGEDAGLNPPAEGDLDMTGVLFSVELNSFGVGQKIYAVDPGDVDPFILCLSPSGKILSETGHVLESGCKDVNFRMYLSRGSVGDDLCPEKLDDQDGRNQRQINDTYFVDLSYSGQVRVIQ